ncbi:DUF3068 domain-containing protein [Nocardioides sp.]|uniref:DUF3068 domain-containing protein n=1 Tax=Nocardioides sp. TaxID=35761 RepID=UPI003513766D
MRRISTQVLIGLGVFLVVAAGLVRFYAYPQLARVPASYESTTRLEARGATVFDAATLAPITTDLAITSYTIADTSADVADGFTSWINRTSIVRADVPGATCDPAVDPAKPGCFKQDSEQVPFDVVSGAAPAAGECDGCVSTYDRQEIVGNEYVGVPTDVVRTGQVYKMPIDTQARDYPWWDSSAQEATPARFEGEEELDGLRVYKFVQEVPETIVGTQDLPGSVFGVDADTVTADVSYAMTRTLWVEPVTGAPVDRVDDRRQVFVYDGQEVAAFVGQIAYTDDEVSALVDDARTQAFLLGGLRGLFPLGLGGLGLLALVAGVVLARREAAPAASQRELVDA